MKKEEWLLWRWHGRTSNTESWKSFLMASGRFPLASLSTEGQPGFSLCVHIRVVPGNLLYLKSLLMFLLYKSLINSPLLETWYTEHHHPTSNCQGSFLFLTIFNQVRQDFLKGRTVKYSCLLGRIVWADGAKHRPCLLMSAVHRLELFKLHSFYMVKSSSLSFVGTVPCKLQSCTHFYALYHWNVLNIGKNTRTYCILVHTVSPSCSVALSGHPNQISASINEHSSTGFKQSCSEYSPAFWHFLNTECI